MRRVIDYSQPKLSSSRFEVPVLDLVYNSTRQVLINKVDTNSGNELLIVPFVNQYGIIIPISYNDWMIDLDETGVNQSERIGGLVDNVGLAASTKYLVFAFSNDSYEPIGFGIIAQPYSTCTIAGGTKGNSATFTVINKAYRFTIGARIESHNLIAGHPNSYNLGTITSIDSITQIVALMDNDSNYGSNLAIGGGSEITQLNKFRPYLPDDSTQQTIYPNYRFIGEITTDTISNIQVIRNSDLEFINTPVNDRNVWHFVDRNNEPAFQNSWANYPAPFNLAQFMKDESGFVHLIGMVRNGNPVLSVIFTLPQYYRPVSYQYLFDIISNSAQGRIDIYTNGDVKVLLGNNTWVSLDGISFNCDENTTRYLTEGILIK